PLAGAAAGSLSFERVHVPVGLVERVAEGPAGNFRRPPTERNRQNAEAPHPEVAEARLDIHHSAASDFLPLIVEEDDELVAAPAERRVGVPDGRLQEAPDVPQDLAPAESAGSV